MSLKCHFLVETSAVALKIFFLEPSTVKASETMRQSPPKVCISPVDVFHPSQSIISLRKSPRMQMSVMLEIALSATQINCVE